MKQLETLLKQLENTFSWLSGVIWLVEIFPRRITEYQITTLDSSRIYDAYFEKSIFFSSFGDIDLTSAKLLYKQIN